MTDPECHKEHCNRGATHVTDIEPGESSFACSSSGISSCDSDEESTSSEDNDDDDDDEDDSEGSSSFSGKKWTTKNGYNLTTFDQTEIGGKWESEPLPLPLWAKESKSTLVIEKVSL